MRSIVILPALLLGISLGPIAGIRAEERKVVTELFTSTTCPPCYNADHFYFESWLPGYSDRARVITITYHVWWPSPGTDPMYHANTAPVRARASYYQGGSLYVPRMFINGHRDGTHVYSGWPAIISNELMTGSPLRISLGGFRDATSMTVSISVTATAPVSTANWRLHCVVVEDGISEPQASSSGYVPFTHDWVHRDMIPDAGGTALAIQQGQTVSVDRGIAIRSGWDPQKCKVVVFVQDQVTKQIQQAEAIDVSALTLVTVDPVRDPLPGVVTLSQNYPNPFNSSTAIRYSLPREMTAKMTILNALGQEVAVPVEGEQDAGYHEITFDASRLPSGVYFYRLRGGEFVRTGKMLLTR